MGETIREHMPVVANDGQHVGTVDGVEGDHIKLTQDDATSSGQHHLIPLSWVDAVEGGTVKLTRSYGDALQNWQPAG